MAGQYKGTGIFLMHKLFSQHSQDAEKNFMSSLAPADQEAFKLVTSTSWIPIDLASRLLEKGSAILYPTDRLGLRKLGQEQAVDNLNGVYKALLRIVSVELAMSKCAYLWKTYFDQGAAHVEKISNLGKDTHYFMVTGFPELPLVSREVAAGFMEGVFKLAKVNQYQVIADYAKPDTWKWQISWN